MIDIMENKVLGPAIRQGIAQGKAEGERAVLLRLLARRFGNVPPNILARLESATESDLMIWADRVLTAKTIEEIFRPA